MPKIEYIGEHLQLVGDGYTVDPRDVIAEFADGVELTHVVVVGVDEDGNLTGSSSHGRPDTMMMLDRAKAKLLASYGDIETEHGDGVV